MRRALRIAAAFAAVLVILAVAGVLWLRAGARLPAEPPPADLAGELYMIRRDDDELLKVYRQPANQSAEPVLAFSREGCPEENCNIIELRQIDGIVEYQAMSQGNWFWWRDGVPTKPTSDKDWDLEEERHAGVTAEKGSLYLGGELIVQFNGKYSFKFASGYHPVTWSPDRRYLLFWFSGYANGDAGLISSILDITPASAGQYAWDRETGMVYRLGKASNGAIWAP